MPKKEKRYVIDETSILPDLLEDKHLYLDKGSKSLVMLNTYDIYFNFFGKELIKVKNEKVAKVLFSQNRQELPKEE